MTERTRRAADWLSIPEALDRILAAVRPLDAEAVPLRDALGRTLAETVTSPVDQPPWDNSAMDGYAVRAEDVRGASDEAPVTLVVVDDVPAGSFPSRPVGPGQATRIMTGAPIPEGADSVVRVEHTEGTPEAPPGEGERVRVHSGADARRNIRRRGEDLRAGEVVLEGGRVLRSAEIGVLATAGKGDVAVHRRPRVAILSNGDELVDLDRFDDVLAGRRIVNSNAYALAAAVRATGCEPVVLGIARDEPQSLRERLEAARGADALVTTAGASVGERDLIKDVLEEIGFVLDFWRVRMRPGSPFSFGRLDGIAVFGLAGNPVSALVTFEVLVRPALRRMLGRRAVHSRTVQVRAAERIPGARGLTHFPRAVLEPDGQGGWRARLTGPQGSGILTSMAAAEALLVVPLGVAAIAPGDAVTAVPLDAPDAAAPDLGFLAETK